MESVGCPKLQDPKKIGQCSFKKEISRALIKGGLKPFGIGRSMREGQAWRGLRWGETNKTRLMKRNLQLEVIWLTPITNAY